MKRILCLLLSLFLLLSSCGMEEVIPQQTETFSMFYDNEELYLDCIEILSELGHNSLVSRPDYYAAKGSEDFTDLYIQNMETGEFSVMEEEAIRLLFENSSVKLIDYFFSDDLEYCTFDMCIPGKNFDYGIYYVSVDEPIFFGDLAAPLTENGNGYSYEKKADFGVSYTYFTEKITDYIYYYEIM